MLPTPVNPNKLHDELDGYDKILQLFLVNGFKLGFSLGCISTPTSTNAKNHASAMKHGDVTNAHIQEGLRLNRIAGPFSHPSL